MEVPTFETLDGLAEYIRIFSSHKGHDYGTAVYAMSMAAVATFEYVAKELGVTGFQASYASLDVLRRVRQLKGPFILLKAEDMLCPQYDLHRSLSEAMAGWEDWAAEEARKKIASASSTCPPHPNVMQRWVYLASRGDAVTATEPAPEPAAPADSGPAPGEGESASPGSGADPGT